MTVTADPSQGASNRPRSSPESESLAENEFRFASRTFVLVCVTFRCCVFRSRSRIESDALQPYTTHFTQGNPRYHFVLPWPLSSNALRPSFGRPLPRCAGSPASAQHGRDRQEARKPSPSNSSASLSARQSAACAPDLRRILPRPLRPGCSVFERTISRDAGSPHGKPKPRRQHSAATMRSSESSSGF